MFGGGSGFVRDFLGGGLSAIFGVCVIGLPSHQEIQAKAAGQALPSESGSDLEGDSEEESTGSKHSMAQRPPALAPSTRSATTPGGVPPPAYTAQALNQVPA
jgi:hypothetical protein